MQWFCPAPWRVSACTIDLRPGGAFNTTFCSPDGEEHLNVGCYLEVVPGERLVFTDALGPGYRPAAAPFMTGVLELFPEGDGTRYRASSLHVDAEARDKHEAMGFHTGWGAALDQLVALMQARR